MYECNLKSGKGHKERNTLKFAEFDAFLSIFQKLLTQKFSYDPHDTLYSLKRWFLLATKLLVRQDRE